MWLRLVAPAAIVALWLPRLARPLWVDEAGTWFVVKDGPREAVARAFEFHGQSPLYYLVAWASTALLGKSEVALRLPSVLAMAIAAWLVARLGRRLHDEEAGSLAAAFFVAHAAPFAWDARPYGLAVMLAVLGTFGLVRWVDEGRPRDALLHVTATAAAIYAHYLLGLVVIAHVAYALIASPTWRVAVRRLALPAAGTAALVAPLSFQVLALARRSESLSFGTTPTQADLVAALVPPVVLVVLGAAAFAARPIPALEKRAPLAFALAWHAVPVLLVYGVARATPAKIFVFRYLAASVPALALLVGGTLRHLGSRRVALAAILALVGALGLKKPPTGSRWDLVAAELAGVGSATPVLVPSALVESRDVAWLEDPARRSYLLPELAFYAIPGRVVPLSFAVAPETIDHFERLLAGELRPARRFVLVRRNPPEPRDFWLDGRLRSEPFASRPVPVGDLLLVFYEAR